MEWAKAKARAERWTEEVQLVQEEMRRTITYCRHRAEWWRSRAALRRDVPPELADGLAAYAFEHADLEERFAADLERRWAVVRAKAREFIDSGYKFPERPDQEPETAPALPAETITLNLRELDALEDSDDED